MRRRYLYGVVTAAVVAACRAAAIEVMNEIDLDLSRERGVEFPGAFSRESACPIPPLHAPTPLIIHIHSIHTPAPLTNKH